MADYSTIKGFTIQSLASDPYASAAASGTWASGGATNTARWGAAGFTPTADLAVIAGGAPPDPMANCETYDGTSWSEVNNLTTARRSMPGVGTQTSGLVMAGYAGGDVANVESWDGTCWTAETAVTTARRAMPGFGASNTSALLCATGSQANTELWNGTTWTEVVDPSTPRGQSSGTGIATSGIYVAGNPPSNYTKAETWDGTSWTSVTDMAMGRGEGAGASGITNSDALIFGGRSPPGADIANTEFWNGSTWTEVSAMATVRIIPARGVMGGGSTYALAVTGTPPSSGITTTEEWALASPLSLAGEGQVWYNTTSTVLKGFGLTLGSGAWASGTVVNTGRLNASAAGASQDSAVFMGGAPVGGTAVAITEQYDGTTWTEVGDLNIPRKLFVGIGTQTAAIAAGGVAPTPTPVGPNLQECEQWNGTSWTEIADLGRSDTPPVSTSYAMGFGTTTSAIFAGGAEGNPGQLSLSEQWNGTSWSEGNDLTHSMGYGAMAGASGDSGLITGGGTFVPAWDAYDGNQVWDGTSWSEQNNLNQKRYGCIGSNQGTVTNSLVFGGNTNAPAASADTEHWDGTCWTELANLSTGRWYLGGAGVGRNALAISGNAPPTTAVVEEWTVPTSYTTKTFTAS